MVLFYQSDIDQSKRFCQSHMIDGIQVKPGESKLRGCRFCDEFAVQNLVLNQIARQGDVLLSCLGAGFQ